MSAETCMWSVLLELAAEPTAFILTAVAAVIAQREVTLTLRPEQHLGKKKHSEEAISDSSPFFSTCLRTSVE